MPKKPYVICARYVFPSMDDLEKIVETTSQLCDAKKVVDSHHPEVSLIFSGPSYFRPLKQLEYKFEFKGNDEELCSAFDMFIIEAGVPRLILRGSNYELAERVLNNHGKKTESRRFTYEGRWIIDK